MWDDPSLLIQVGNESVPNLICDGPGFRFRGTILDYRCFMNILRTKSTDRVATYRVSAATPGTGCLRTELIRTSLKSDVDYRPYNINLVTRVRK